MPSYPKLRTTAIALTAAVAAALAAFSASSEPAGAAGSTPVVASPVSLPRLVSQTPVSWTPNVSATTTVGKTACNTQYFGSAESCQSEVYDTTYVNGEVIAVGAFTEVCQPGPYKQGLCAAGTQVTRDDIFAYQAGTGLIDPNFVPVIDQGPVFAVVPGPPGSNTVIIGGAFTTVNGQSHRGIAEINVDPGTTTGETADGSVVTTFAARVSNQVHDLALSPDGSAVYVGGQFTSVDGLTTFADGQAVDALARLNSATGALDQSFAFGLGSPVTNLPLKVEAMALSPDGTRLVETGSALAVNGQSRPRMAVIDTGGSLGSPSALSDWTAPILTNGCSMQHDYVRGVAFSPDGSFVVIATTGYTSDGSTPYSVCDAVAKFPVDPADTTSTGTPVPVSPSWINYGGGDSFYSVTVAGNVVYAGGHNRWANNYCGRDAVCGPNAVIELGISALDANTGVAIAFWHPYSGRGRGTMYLSTFPAGTYDGSHPGLVMGMDVDVTGDEFHSENAIFPLEFPGTPGAGGPIPSGMFNEEGGSSTSNALCLDGSPSASGSVVHSVTCTNAASQDWLLPGDGTVRLNGLCLDTTGEATTPGTTLSLSPCSGAATQSWQQGPGQSLVNQGATTAQGSPMCLDDPTATTTSPAGLAIQSCDGNQSQSWPLPAAEPPPTTTPTGLLYPQLIQSDRQIPCLDDNAGVLAANNPVVLKTCIGWTEQQWTMQPGGAITIGGGAYCLDVQQVGSTYDAVVNPCNGSTEQQWLLQPNRLLENAAFTSPTPMCLQSPGSSTTNGTRLTLGNCAPGNNQYWWAPAA